MSGQVYLVDNVHVTAATEKLARFKVLQKLQIQIETDTATSECSTLMSRDDEPPTPTSCSVHDDDGQLLGDEETSCEKKKRRRRTAAQIDRKFVCSYAGCKKAYGSEGSLTQHMRLKHRSLTLSHRDRVVSTYFNCNNIAIRPAVNFMLDMAAYSSAPAGFLHESADVFHGMEKLRMRSNSMPSEGCIQQCDTPRWARKKSTIVTPHSARASKTKSLKGKIKRSQSMSSPPDTPERSVFTTPRGLVPSVEALHLSPHCTYLPQATEPYRGKDCVSMLSTLDWDGAASMKEEADASSNNNNIAATDLSMLQSLVDDCTKHGDDVMMGMSPEHSTPTSPPLYAEFPLDDDMMGSNQYDNDVYHKDSSPSVSSSSSTSSGWNNSDMDLVSSSFLQDPSPMLLTPAMDSFGLPTVLPQQATLPPSYQFCQTPPLAPSPFAAPSSSSAFYMS